MEYETRIRAKIKCQTTSIKIETDLKNLESNINFEEEEIMQAQIKKAEDLRKGLTETQEELGSLEKEKQRLSNEISKISQIERRRRENGDKEAEKYKEKRDIPVRKDLNFKENYLMKSQPSSLNEEFHYKRPLSINPSPSKIQFVNTDEVADFIKEVSHTDQLELANKFQATRARLQEERIKVYFLFTQELRELFDVKSHLN